MLSRHVVLVPDIVRLVFNEVGDEDKPTLARSARCCRAFHDAALDVLWKNLESVDPLRGLLPERGLGDDGTPVSTHCSYPNFCPLVDLMVFVGFHLRRTMEKIRFVRSARQNVGI